MNRNKPVGFDAGGWVVRLARLQPWYLLTRYPNRWTKSIFAFVNGSIAIGIMSGAAVCTAQPLIFPSLGPSAFLFFYRPASVASAPRSAILAHGTAILIGFFTFRLFSAFFEPGSAGAQIGAAALSMGLISAAMILFDMPHPPAASTALVIALGLVSGWAGFVAIMVAIVLLTAQAYSFNRLSSVYYPLWRSNPSPRGDEFVVAPLRIESPPSPRDKYARIADQLVGRESILPPESRV